MLLIKGQMSEFEKLENFTTEHCLHATERLVKTMRKNANKFSQDIDPLVRSLVFIERRVVWQKKDLQRRFIELVNKVASLMTHSSTEEEIENTAALIGEFNGHILLQQPDEQKATPEEVGRFKRRLARVEKRVQKILSLILNPNAYYDNETKSVLGEKYNALNNLCCNARSWVQAKNPDANFIVTILDILDARVTELENDCTLWDRIVDTIAPYFDTSHSRRCFRRSSQTA